MGSVSESDDETPEVISSVRMRSEREEQLREMFSLKRKLQEELKLKRKLKAEKLINQKKAKLLRNQLMEMEQTELPDAEGDLNADLEIVSDDNVGLATCEDSAAPDKRPKQLTSSRRVYPKFNIVVEPLTKIPNRRASTAINFKEKRLAKVPRENVALTLTSYQEKMRVKK